MSCSGQTLLLMQMGVERIFLDAAGEDAKSVWCALGFLVITDSQYKVLACQYCLVLNQYIAARCLQLVPNEAALLAQVSCTCTDHRQVQ